ncbi:FAD-binding and (Fe-S)-binding domain-containing protein [Rhabdaerophilum sp.]|uniref:FAD-binding and (Fe-S)-binding domain-containing protein n=1 Tax=Rhabdaerophilum sp. TaxID=2717341 RepID=UPI0038D42380
MGIVDRRSSAADIRNIALERRLGKALQGEVAFDAFTRGRYATDASIYQIMPMGVVFPRSTLDISATLEVAREHEMPVIFRGGGTSQNGQPIGPGLVVDCSRHFNGFIDYDAEGRRVRVQPGMVLERLNARLRADGLFFPVEPSTASRCTIGGMTGNNSCGARSLVFGKMVDHVTMVDALLADGAAMRFERRAAMANQPLADAMLNLAERERAEIEMRYPKVQRRVGGYNLDSLLLPDANLAHLLVGSEGTLAAFTAIELQLTPLPKHRVMGVCQFPSFRSAMETTRQLVALAPTAVELVDQNVLSLGADIPLFVRTLSRITRGRPDCLLLTEFAGDDPDALRVNLRRLDEAMADLGFPDAVVEVLDAGLQKQVWEVREACLNIMMSMKGDGKPVSFIEDCAVPLEHLADYTDAMTALFEKHGTRGTWYAHASVGCLHVRPILDMKTEAGVRAMRAIAEETTELVRRFKGSYSGEHGDGISRSEFIAPMFGERLSLAFSEVKTAFDPANRLNPGKIVAPFRMDDRRLMRFDSEYATVLPAAAALDWSEWGGFAGAVEMCNNNGACRKRSGGAMCPSFRVTEDEAHVTRGRANVLRLAISGQLGFDAFTSPEMKEAMSLCVGCKACQRECPTGVDMAKMKIEFQHHYAARHGLGLRDRLVGWLPRYAPLAQRFRGIANLRNRLPLLRHLMERMTGFSAERPLPEWREPWREDGSFSTPDDVRGDGLDLVILVDTFNRNFEPENLASAMRVLRSAGYRLHHAKPTEGKRPPCCGRTFLSVGQVAEARAEMDRLVATYAPLVAKGARIVGLEPSCLLTLRDELRAVRPGADAAAIGRAAFLIEEVLAADLASGRVTLPLADQQGLVAHLNGHCHQKAADVMSAVEACLRAVPGLEVKLIESSCCGMAGSFGYQAETLEISRAMAEASLLPAIRAAGVGDIIVADGTSCRHQIADGASREALHVVRVLDQALVVDDALSSSEPAITLPGNVFARQRRSP